MENVISNADYLFFKRKLKITGFYKWYYIVWFLTATGARISELIKIKIEHIQLGYFDVYSKSGKTRRLYIPSKLSLSLKKWLLEEKRDSGYLFLNKYNNSISSRGVSQGLKKFAKKFGLDTNVVYPHSFRHLYAKNFLEKFNDISLLADIMGHESIETTRIYLRKTFSEQQKIIDSVVDW
ncbi:tyrosine-type recombinase/integrase [Mycoplasmopsis bovis]|uniref:tyrosine-type recombinase/integrase n=1 Tax=Mycoplasmopsis bovis TaxID=28903 RepID=UPI00272A6EA1|nr:tyrosine-type recombinase/integrase [Mycoplasmopsis bovis]